MTKIFTTLLTLFLLVCLFSCSKEQEKTLPSGKILKIGVIGPMSGPDKVLGQDCLEGIQTVVGLHPLLDNGDTLELLVEDDKNKPELAVKAFIKLVETDKVAVVIVASSSTAALAINSLADQHKTPTVILLASHPDISKGTKYISQITFDNNFQARVAALFVRDELLLERVAVFMNMKSNHSSSLAIEFIRKFGSIEGQVSDVIHISAETVDYGEILSHLRDNDVQLLYLPIAAEHVIEISKKMVELKWTPMAMGGDGLLTRALAQRRDDAHYLEGFYTTDLYSSDVEMSVHGEKVAKAFRTKFKTRGSTFPAIGVEGMAILRHAINRCDDVSDRDCINTKLHETVDFLGIMGNITIQPSGKALRPLAVNRIRKGQLEFIVKVY